MTEAEIGELAILVGEWSLDASFPDARAGGAGGRTTFEWMPGERFLVQRWEAPDPVPEGIALIGADPSGDGYLQHYFDSRGVARVYGMTLAEGTWKLWRDEEDFSPLSFSQRFTGKLSDDGNTIAGRWEIAHDGSTWEHDFDLTYRRVTS